MMWKLKFNVSTCNILHLGTLQQQHTFCLCGTAIQSAQSVRDLGVMIDQGLKFHKHTLLVTNKANRILGLIKTCLNSNMLAHLYKSMVWPLLEHGNRICPGSYYLMNQRKVKAIQCKATKLITSLCDTDYSTRLAELR